MCYSRGQTLDLGITPRKHAVLPHSAFIAARKQLLSLPYWVVDVNLNALIVLSGSGQHASELIQHAFDIFRAVPMCHRRQGNRAGDGKSTDLPCHTLSAKLATPLE